MILTIANYASGVSAIIALCCLVIRPIRDHLFGTKARNEAQKSLLRSEMLRIYKEHQTDKTLTEDEYTNFKMLYDAYIDLKGNSFIIKIWREIDKEWTVTVR